MQSRGQKTGVWSQLSPEDLHYHCVLTHSVVSDSLWAHGLQSARLLCHGIFQARILELVAIRFSRWSFQPSDLTHVSCIAGRFFICWAIGEALITFRKGLPKWLSGKESTCQCRRCGFNPWVGKIPSKRGWLPTPVFLSGKSHGQRSLVGYSPWGHKESDTTEHYIHTHTFRKSVTSSRTLPPPLENERFQIRSTPEFPGILTLLWIISVRKTFFSYR